MTLRQAVFGRLPVFVAGLYCVLVTVLPVAFAPGAPPAAHLGAWACLLSLPVGLLVPIPRLGLLAGMVGVLGGAFVVFAATLAAGRELPAPGLGVLGFFALPLAWGALSSPAARQGVGQGAPTDWLRPRRTVARWQVVLAGLALLLLPLLLLAPLGLESPAKATFTLVVVLGVVVLLARGVSDSFTRFWVETVPAHEPRRTSRLVARVLLIVLGLAAVVLLRLY